MSETRVIVYEYAYKLFEAIVIFVQDDRIKNDGGACSESQQNFEQLENIEMKLEDEDLLLLNLLPKTYEYFKDTLLFENAYHYS